MNPSRNKDFANQFGILQSMSFRTILIDLDETLYPAGCGVWEAISARMEAYIHERLGVPREVIPALRRSLYEEFGTTLRGLQHTRTLDAGDFLDYVHNVPLDSLLQPDPELRAVLLRYPQRKIIFTNADRRHAGRVIDRLGLDGCFDGIIDIEDMTPFCKPMPEAFQTALRLAGETDPAQCVFLDDSPRNLAGARTAGFYTIQVGSPKAGLAHSQIRAHALIARLADLPQFIAPCP